MRPLSDHSPDIRGGYSACARTLAWPQQSLDDQHVSPLAVELAVSAMQPDLREAAALDQADAREVVGEELADHLVETQVDRDSGKGFGQHRAEPLAARIGGDIDAALADPRVAGAGAVGSEGRPAEDTLPGVA